MKNKSNLIITRMNRHTLLSNYTYISLNQVDLPAILSSNRYKKTGEKS